MQQNIRNLLVFTLFITLMTFCIFVDEQVVKIVSLSCAWPLAIALMLEFMRVWKGDDDDHRR